ncbi:hypothetical protein ACHAWF_001519 [Thalassiosira exigua]
MESTISKFYASVETRFAIRVMIVCGIAFVCTLKQINFIMAYPQEPIECDLYTKVPNGISVNAASAENYTLKLPVSVYDQKQGGQVWNNYLTHKIVDELEFVSSYNLDNFIQEHVDAKLKVEVMCHPNNFVDVNIQRQSDVTFNFVHTALINQIIADCGLTMSTTKKQVPVKCNKILLAHLDSPKFDSLFNYRSVINKLSYLAQMAHSDVIYTVHSCVPDTASTMEGVRSCCFGHYHVPQVHVRSPSSSSPTLRRDLRTTSTLTLPATGILLRLPQI